MHLLPVSQDASGIAIVSMRDADEHGIESVAAEVQSARTQRYPLEDQARELRGNFQRLASLLPGDGEIAVAREAIEAMAGPLSEVEWPMSDDQKQLFGKGRGQLLALCKALERDQRASTVAAACRDLSLAFNATREPTIPPELAIEAALGQVEGSSLVRNLAHQAARHKPTPAQLVQRPFSADPDVGDSSVSPGPRRFADDVPIDICFVGRHEDAIESFAAFVNRSGRDALIDAWQLRLGALERSASESGQEPSLIQRATEAPRAAAVEALDAVARAPTPATDGALLFGLGRYALEELLARLDAPQCDGAMKDAAFQRLLPLWASNASGSAGLVSAMFETMNVIDTRLAGTDNLAQDFLNSRWQLMAQAIAETAASLVAQGAAPEDRERGLAWIRARLGELLAMPELEPASDVGRSVDVDAALRAVFNAMPKWRDAAVVASMAHRHGQDMIAFVEARTGCNWTGMTLDSARLAIAELTSLAAQHVLPWSLAMSEQPFLHYLAGGWSLHRDTNPLGLDWLLKLKDGGLVRKGPCNMLGRYKHPRLNGECVIVQAQGALCGLNYEGHYLPVEVSIANDHLAEVRRTKTNFLSSRLKATVVASIEARDPGGSQRLDPIWMNGLSGSQ